MRSSWMLVFFLIGVGAQEVYVPPGYEEVTTKATGGGSFGAIERCGEGTTRGTHLCVPYYQCDGETKTIIQDGRTDGFGILEVRFGSDENPCDHYLEVCCGIPKDVPSSSTENDNEPPIIDPDVPPVIPTSRPKPEGLKSCGIRNENGLDFKLTYTPDRESQYGEFPWMAAILKTKHDSKSEHLLVCGGSLITTRVVLTAAHCVYKKNARDLKVRLGEWDTQTQNERLPYQERAVKQIIVHEEYNPSVLFNDVALLILDTPVEEAEHIGTICLPEVTNEVSSEECVVNGWGKHKFEGEGYYSSILKKIQLPTVPHAECQERLRKTRLGKFFILDKSFICAGGIKDRDACTGDGGSPLVCPIPGDRHRYHQVGIVAWGIGCGDEIPAVYVNIPRFKGWIERHLQQVNQEYN